MQVLMGRGIDADCLLCGSADENRDHLFFPNLIPLRYGKQLYRFVVILGLLEDSN
jgi:hypothetical protein